MTVYVPPPSVDLNNMKSEIIEITERTEITLSDCEAVIACGFNTFREVGSALLQIRDRKLYAENYASFEQYCRHRWQLSRPYAYSLMESAEVAKNLSAMADIPTHERQIRPLAKLPPELQRKVWAEATKDSKNPTARHVKVVANRLTRDSSVVRLMPAPPLQEQLRNRLQRIIPELIWYRDAFSAQSDLHDALAQSITHLEYSVGFIPESERKRA